MHKLQSIYPNQNQKQITHEMKAISYACFKLEKKPLEVLKGTKAILLTL